MSGSDDLISWIEYLKEKTATISEALRRAKSTGLGYPSGVTVDELMAVRSAWKDLAVAIDDTILWLDESVEIAES